MPSISAGRTLITYIHYLGHLYCSINLHVLFRLWCHIPHLDTSQTFDIAAVSRPTLLNVKIGAFFAT